MITPEVAAAIEEVQQAFPGCSLTFEEDGQGGAYATVSGIELGAKYDPATTWFGFQITFQYPRADIYPHFIDSNVRRMDGRAHCEGVGGGTWRNKPAWQ